MVHVAISLFLGCLKLSAACYYSCTAAVCTHAVSSRCCSYTGLAVVRLTRCHSGAIFLDSAARHGARPERAVVISSGRRVDCSSAVAGAAVTVAVTVAAVLLRQVAT